MSEDTKKTPFTMGKIADQEKRGWKVKINGEVIENVEDLEIESERFGTLHYGSNGLYDTWCFDELGGGGAVTIPYMIHPTTGCLFVGVVKQNRPLLGGEVWEVPRGFMDPSDKDKSETALREALEEIGYEFSRPVHLAKAKNPNSTFFNTSLNEDDGVSFYGLPVEASLLYRMDASEITGSYLDEMLPSRYFIFPSEIRDAAKGDGCEKIYGSRFVPIDEILDSPDMFSAAAGFYLLQFLQKRNVSQYLIY